jgi:VRR-NUC domain
MQRPAKATSSRDRRAGSNPAPSAQSEKQFEQAVVEYARLCGWLVWHPFDSRRSAAGYPDLTLLRGGVLLFAELKAERGKLSSAQCEWLQELARVGQQNVRVHVWRPKDWPTIELELAR